MNNLLCIVCFFFVLQTTIPGIFSLPKTSTCRNEIRYDLKSGIGDSHIIGGKEVEPHSHPHQVGFSLPSNSYEGFCGGSLISDIWVVTAAHCTYFWFINKIVAGAHRIRETENETQVLLVDKVYLHPEYDIHKKTNDISLIRLSSPANLNNYVQPIRLPSQTQKNCGFWRWPVTITGWGSVSDENHSVSSVLRGVDSKIVSNWYCSLRYLFQYVYKTNICASGSNSKGTCHGDSGGPLTIKEEDGKRTLIGISSFSSKLGCEKSWPVVFTRVTSYLDWIHNITRIPKRY